jgi:hypothetical protein
MRNLVLAAAGRFRAAVWALVLTLAALSFAVPAPAAASTHTGGQMSEHEAGASAAVVVDDMTVEAIAVVAHEANRAYCEVIGDASQKSWHEAAQWQRDSARAGVRAALDGTARTPEAQHEAWAEHKRADGWVYGPEKSEAAKTHPCLVPYADLPVEQRRKDHLFRAVVQALTAQDSATRPLTDAEVAGLRTMWPMVHEDIRARVAALTFDGWAGAARMDVENDSVTVRTIVSRMVSGIMLRSLAARGS